SHKFLHRTQERRRRQIVTSGDDDKIRACEEMGVVAGFNYHREDWHREAAQIGFDAIIDSAGGNAVNHYLKMIRPGGRIVIYGSTTGYPEKLDVFRLFWSQAYLMGSTMGNDQEFQDMLAYISTHQLKPRIDRVFRFEDHILAFDRFKNTDSFGKIIIRFS
ncbi:MAG: zinc-binding dehydrogenase, partial [Bacteroidota bacterium]